MSERRVPENGRTHIPDLKEVVADLDGLRDLMDERDKRYAQEFQHIYQRFETAEESVKSALASQDKFNTVVSENSREAVNKAELAQRGVNERQNEFRGQLSDQASTFMPRREAEASLKALQDVNDREGKLLRDDINNLKLFQREMTAVNLKMQETRHETRDTSQWVTGLLIGAGIGVAGIAIAVAQLFISMKK